MERKSCGNAKPSLKALEMLELEIQRREESETKIKKKIKTKKTL